MMVALRKAVSAKNIELDANKILKETDIVELM